LGDVVVEGIAMWCGVDCDVAVAEMIAGQRIAVVGTDGEPCCRCTTADRRGVRTIKIVINGMEERWGEGTNSFS
jgi:hypothetical protein